MLTPRPDGRVESQAPVTLPIMAPRLQGELHADGRVEVALWGAGDLGRLRFSALAGPYVHAPNLVTTPSGGAWAAQSDPVLVLRGVAYRGFTPARKCASWDRTAHPKSKVTRRGERRRIDLPWAVLLIETRGADLVVSAGADLDEAERGLGLTVETIVTEAEHYAAHCDQLPQADPVLRSMVMQGTHAALSSVRRDDRGRFDGLAAGLAYSAPARTYYRDGYWTLQLLLTAAPAVVHAQIDLLAAGVQPDGEAPSGVIVSGPEMAQAWETLRTTVFGYDWIHKRRADWWSDHFDSPLFFVLALGDYVRATGDVEPVDRNWPFVRAIYERYVELSRDGLPAKPRHDRDWADNVYRAGHVSYNIGLWIGTLDAIVELGARQDPDLAVQARATAQAAREAVAAQLKRPHGGYPDYLDTLADIAEDHLTLDSLTLLRHDAVPGADALEVLESVRRRLETRHNPGQGFGDWGMMCVHPPFSRRGDLRSKTVFPYRYHNGSDWPWLDGLYAGERLRRGLPGWRYPLTRWWEFCLSQGWMGAVEYFSPPWGRGSLLQGWSSLPAAVALAHRETVLAGDTD
ncbi:MAG: glycogen debranching protein [Pseudomonadota bacterium]